MFLRVALNVLLTCTKSSLGFVQYDESKNCPFTCYHWEKVKSNPNQESFLYLLFCTNQVICFCSILSFKKSPSLLPTGKRILLPHFEKKLFPSPLMQKNQGKYDHT